ncbi:MAG: hypothetical protein PHY93_21255, partial [Bacteriovorax sp.]|nr:hypothetical protein [Bacteriovorax sp.]
MVDIQPKENLDLEAFSKYKENIVNFLGSQKDQFQKLQKRNMLRRQEIESDYVSEYDLSKSLEMIESSEKRKQLAIRKTLLRLEFLRPKF